MANIKHMEWLMEKKKEKSEKLYQSTVRLYETLCKFSAEVEKISFKKK